VIELEAVTVRFDGRVALRDVTASFPAGCSVALMGPNGSGKTTLLRVLGGLLQPSSGRVRRSGEPAVAFVAQHQRQHPWMPLTVGEVLGMARYRQRGLWRPLRRADRAAMTAAAERLDVADLTRRSFQQLSGGQRQRVLVAAALASDAEMLLLDEPITGLDPPSQQRILGVVDDERDSGRLVVLSTHHLDEARRCDRVLLLANVEPSEPDRQSSVVADGSPAGALTSRNLDRAFGSHVVDEASRPGTIVLDEHGHAHDHATTEPAHAP